ncbi:RDD family protein [Luteibacter sp.]|uniref:RDD family protein n=1 Tax=Luteibacter sp. TaxID=1886636 RepID=UPI003F7F0068
MNDNFYAAPQAELEVAPPPFRRSVESRKAGRGVRLGAAMIDGAIIGVIAMIAAMCVGFSRGATGGKAGAVGGIIAFTLVLVWIVINIGLLARHGQTIGKRALGIAIVRSDGAPCELWRILVLRIFAVRAIGVVPMVGPLFSLVDVLLIFGEERRCVHDYMADTVVVHT